MLTTQENAANMRRLDPSNRKPEFALFLTFVLTWAIALILVNPGTAQRGLSLSDSGGEAIVAIVVSLCITGIVCPQGMDNA